MNIYDCFTYFNEDALLEIRMETLDHWVNYFVIAEATHTQTGLPKPLNFKPEKFEKFRSKIIYIAVNDMPLQLNSAWANENHQRKSLMRGLVQAKPEDLIIVSDLDEIPHPQKISLYRPEYLRATFMQRLFYYKFNNEAVDPITQKSMLWSTLSGGGGAAGAATSGAGAAAGGGALVAVAEEVQESSARQHSARQVRMAGNTARAR